MAGVTVGRSDAGLSSPRRGKMEAEGRWEELEIGWADVHRVDKKSQFFFFVIPRNLFLSLIYYII